LGLGAEALGRGRAQVGLRGRGSGAGSRTGWAWGQRLWGGVAHRLGLGGLGAQAGPWGERVWWPQRRCEAAPAHPQWALRVARAGPAMQPDASPVRIGDRRAGGEPRPRAPAGGGGGGSSKRDSLLRMPVGSKEQLRRNSDADGDEAPAGRQAADVAREADNARAGEVVESLRVQVVAAQQVGGGRGVWGWPGREGGRLLSGSRDDAGAALVCGRQGGGGCPAGAEQRCTLLAPAGAPRRVCEQHVCQPHGRARAAGPALPTRQQQQVSG